MKEIFRPLDFKNPTPCFDDVALTLAITMLLMSLIVISVALWGIFHSPKLHQSSYAPYY
jgi:hypothetical protein